MEHRRLILDSDNQPVIDYLVKFLGADARLQYDRHDGEKYTVLDILMPEENLKIYYRYIAKGVVLSEKYRYIASRVNIGELSYSKATFLSALLHFDIDSECKEIYSLICGDAEVSLGGVGLFCMTRIKSDWQDILDLVEVLLGDSYDDDDMYSMVNFVMSTRTRREKSLFLAEYPKVLLTNVTDGVIVETLCLFDRAEYNLICAIVGEVPSEFIVERDIIPRELCVALSRLTDVKLL